jgi:hypothetical protein
LPGAAIEISDVKCTDLEEKIKQKILTPEEGVNQDAGTK